MEEKEIEQLLKKSADNIELKDFSERWEAISDRINACQPLGNQQEIKSAALVTSANTAVSGNSFKKKIIFAFCSIAAVIILCLSIVLPLTLGKNKSRQTYLFKDLNNVIVAESDFYNSIENSELKFFDLSDFNIHLYKLIYTKDNKLVGAYTEIIEENPDNYIEIFFYLDCVVSDFIIGNDYKQVEINGYNVKYNTQPTEDIFTTKAKATKGNMFYELTLLTLDDNVISLFDKLFA